MTLEQRLKIKEMLDKGYSVIAIAAELGRCRETIYNELKKCKADGKYDPYYAQAITDDRSGKRSRKSILVDQDLAMFIADMILNDQLSVEQTLVVLKKQHEKFPNIPQSVNTIYRAIDSGLIPGVTRETLLPKTSKVHCGGQVFIPKWVRNQLDIKDGDILQFSITNDNGIIYKKCES